MLQTDHPNLVELKIREEIEQEVRAELEQVEAVVGDQDRRFTALVISAILMVSLFLPLIGLIAGVSLRIFFWAAGY